MPNVTVTAFEKDRLPSPLTLADCYDACSQDSTAPAPTPKYNDGILRINPPASTPDARLVDTMDSEAELYQRKDNRE